MVEGVKGGERDTSGGGCMENRKRSDGNLHSFVPSQSISNTSKMGWS